VAYMSRSQNSKSCQRPKGTWKLTLSIKDAMLFMVDLRLVLGGLCRLDRVLGS